MNPAPPRIARPVSANVLFAGMVLAAAAAGVAGVVFFFNPSTHAFYPVCQFHRLTGWNCPGCGGTRALYALLHGHWLAALRDNALLVMGLPVAAARGIWLAARRQRGQSAEFLPGKYIWPLLILVLAYTVLRNLPAFSFLSPAA